MNPIVSVSLGSGAHIEKFSFLLDTGAEFSTLDSKYSNRFSIPGKKVSRNIASFCGSSTVEGALLDLDVTLPGSRVLKATFFVMNNCAFTIFNPLIESTLRYLLNCKVEISPSYPCVMNNQVELAGVLGNDILSQFVDFKLVPFGNGKLLSVGDGMVPVGPLDCLVGAEELNETISSDAELHKSLNFVLTPKPSYFSPIEQLFPESNVEQGLEYLFSVESIGVKNDYD